VLVQQDGKSSWNRPTDPNIKVDFKGLQTYKVFPSSSNHRYIYINVIGKKMGLNSIHMLVQQGRKSSWNRPTDTNIIVDFKGFQTYKVSPPFSNHRYIYINVIEKKVGLNSIHVLVQQGGKSSM
jgi:hypothetical protein